MGGRMNHPDVFIDQQHGIFPGAGVSSEYFSVTRKMMACTVKGFLVNRPGNGSICIAFHGKINGHPDGLKSNITGRSRYFPRLNRIGIGAAGFQHINGAWFIASL